MQKSFCAGRYISCFTESLGLPESVLRAIVNRSRVYPPSFWLVWPPFFLSAVFVAEWRIGLNSLERRWLWQE